MAKIHPVRSSLAKVPTGLTPLARARLLTGQKIVVIIGPTASGKSDLAIKLARKYNGEIISADSRQVYRGMDIGTSKVKRDKRQETRDKFFSQGVRHHLIDVASPKKQFTADDFKKLGEKAIKEIVAKGPDSKGIEGPRFASYNKSRKANRDKIPIIVGGTGFYIDVLLGRMTVTEVPPNPKLRKRFDRLTAEHLFKMLRKLDPQRAKTIDRHNKRRLIRAIEILLAPSKTPDTRDKNTHFSTKYAMAKSVEKYAIMWIGINPGKERLAKNIKKRLDKRLEQGMVKEVKRLHGQGISWKRLDDFGLEYRWVSKWLKETRNKRQATKKFKNSEEYQKLLREIIKYSKRQMTWFKKNKEIHWLALSKVEGLENKREANWLLVRFLDD